MAIAEIFFPADHPTAAGHFPGNPIIPGALLLAEAIAAIGAELGRALPPCEVKSAKFFWPVRPGDRVAIEHGQAAAGQIKFTCTVEGRTVLSGEIGCDKPPGT